MDKAIRVRVVEVGDDRTAYAWQDYTINMEYTLQQAVRATYAAFPGACQKVVVTNPMNPGVGVIVWDRDTSDASWMRDKYDTIRAGGNVEIWVRTWQPDGGDWAGAGNAAVGPQNARVAALLGDLKRL
jgi:hypothetical protein